MSGQGSSVWIYTLRFHRLMWVKGLAVLQKATESWGPSHRSLCAPLWLLVVSVLAFDHRPMDAQAPAPQSILQAFCLAQTSSRSLHFPPRLTVLVLLTGGSSCSKLKWTSRLTHTHTHTPLGCQQNYWTQISGHQRGYRKSIICQHSTCSFGVV